MKALPFLSKEDPEIPDSYSVSFLYVNGKKEDFELAQHQLNPSLGVMEFVTSEDLWNWVPLSSLQRLTFDKRFSKLMEIKTKSKEETQP